MMFLLHGIFDAVKIPKNSKQPSPHIDRVYWNWPLNITSNIQGFTEEKLKAVSL